ncbi:hypothetical protein P4637_19370 [Halalkalibacterium halodurans]|jgi:hypothetical protein|uniref:BH3311 protein n=1 Tax=Halalkalibacterium halodurans (strain ATCC BAA-125 / DSM 18197 / FERM 7344 / JCM 9153 / C-125) TaxID=272558 RepID=Q9K7Q0_HALH5|nr:hypothetical protein [Halalkalibacterium halodurans]BAB07030.1 BH3311 [Halalkalibacterium halodurans C-125]MDY7223844.1 hypothetical protein [Halalkalibacterium halodurans]MDY7243065.1 hypothetical protein [Halalkalibacterium halodurans]MED4083118.1 hypothetical protein [Halalkalibacterium halodurans]MED4086980.1 hypothetical protein [Halalkalibacterium halodurans]
MMRQELTKSLVDECQSKLDRELTNKELELIQWISERQLELQFSQKSS